MKALWLEDGGLSVREVEVPHADGETLVKVSLSGVCGTDIELTRGYYPYAGIIGHEFVGVVERSPNAALVGRRVVGEINVNCGHCAACRAGRPTHCSARSVLGIAGRDGSHAQYVSLPHEQLHVVPDEVSDEAAVFTEPLAAALQILEQVHIAPSHRVLLIGAGRLGQLAARVLALTAAELTVVARHPHQKDLLRACGIALAEETDIEADSFDIVVEATGSPSGLDLARLALRPRGTLVLKSTYAGAVTIDLSPFVVDEITVVGSRCGPFEPALRMLKSGRVDPVPLLSERYPLSDAVCAIEAAQRSDVMKVVIDA